MYLSCNLNPSSFESRTETTLTVFKKLPNQQLAPSVLSSSEISIRFSVQARNADRVESRKRIAFCCCVIESNTNSCLSDGQQTRPIEIFLSSKTNFSRFRWKASLKLAAAGALFCKLLDSKIYKQRCHLLSWQKPLQRRGSFSARRQTIKKSSRACTTESPATSSVSRVSSLRTRSSRRSFLR